MLIYLPTGRRGLIDSSKCDTTGKCFQQGEGPSRGFFPDCETLQTFVSSSSAQAADPLLSTYCLFVMCLIMVFW